MIDEIRENTEKISLLVELCNDLENKVSSGKIEEENNKLKLNVAKEEILKCTFRIKKVLSQLEATI